MERAARQPGRQPALLTSRLAMCKPGAGSQPAAADQPDSPSNTDPSEMHGHLIVDILTLAFVVVAATLFLIISFILIDLMPAYQKTFTTFSSHQ